MKTQNFIPIYDDNFTGTIFKADKSESFHIADFIMETIG